MRRIPFFRLCIPFIIGILANEWMPDYFLIKAVCLCISFIACGILFYYSNKRYHAIRPFGTVLMLFSCLLGLTIAELQSFENNRSHYTHFLDEHISEYFIKAVVLKKLVKPNSTSYECKITDLENGTLIQQVEGSFILYSEIDSLEQGDIVSMQVRFSEIDAPINKFSFDYQSFQRRKNRIHMVFNPRILKVHRDRSIVQKLRLKIKDSLVKLNIQQTPKSILMAMLLGDKSGIKALDHVFRATGTSHVLAISGLHVGIIAALLNMFFGFLKSNWIRLRYVLIILGAWSFCLVSGMAPSTVRACLMVSCYFIAKIFNEKANGLNFCFVAAFFMLLIDPSKIYDIGFQFSFLAILGILLYFDAIYKAWVFRGFKDRLWQMTALTLSAQVMLTPLSLYYFHEFPLLFLPASLMAIPITFVIVSSGVFVLLIGMISAIPVWLSELLNWLIVSFIELLQVLANIDHSVIQGLNPSILELIFYYLILFCISAHYYVQGLFYKILIAALFCSLLVVQFWENNRLLDKQLVIYAHAKNIHLDVISAGTAWCLDESTSSLASAKWFREPYHLNAGVREVKHDFLQLDSNTIIEVLGKKILVLNQYQDTLASYDYILVNTKLSTLPKIEGTPVIIDFALNNTLRKCHPNIFYKQQIIIH